MTGIIACYKHISIRQHVHYNWNNHKNALCTSGQCWLFQNQKKPFLWSRTPRTHFLSTDSLKMPLRDVSNLDYSATAHIIDELSPGCRKAPVVEKPLFGLQSKWVLQLKCAAPLFEARILFPSPEKRKLHLAVKFRFRELWAGTVDKSLIVPVFCFIKIVTWWQYFSSAWIDFLFIYSFIHSLIYFIYF